MGIMNRYHTIAVLPLIFYLVAAQYESCTGNLSLIANGACDRENNESECGYDGGDCCECTCVDGPQYTCGDISYKCRDPSYSKLLYGCDENYPLTPCRADLPSEWVVNDTASATTLAEAANCSGGLFNVRWQGRVFLNQTILAMMGTEMYVTGTDAEAVVDGDTTTRLFGTVNASLHLSGLGLVNGYAKYGGAIFAKASKVYLNEMSFSGNFADRKGGAIYATSSSLLHFNGSNTLEENEADSAGGALLIDGGSHVSWSGRTHFSRNTGSRGSAMFVSDGSTAHWDAEMTFFNNTATGDSAGAVGISSSSGVSWTGRTSFDYNTGGRGGAIYLEYTSKVSWEGETFFSNHMAEFGGAIYVQSSSHATWSAATSFFNNSAVKYGGALRLYNGSSASWDAQTTFVNNTATDNGGAVAVFDSTVSWSGITSYLRNYAFNGGALSLFTGSTGSWDAETSFIENHANSGGAVNVNNDSVLSWQAETSFYGNEAHRAGALCVLFASNASWRAETRFVNNSATSTGGAVHVAYASSAFWHGTTSFSDNHATEEGGAVYVYDGHNEENPSALNINGATYFDSNGCGGNGGALAVTASSSVTFGTENIAFIGNSANVAGGAVLLSGLGIGPKFVGFRFISNLAKVGGAVYATGCGTEITEDAKGNTLSNPTIVERCEFIANTAGTTGGAVETAAGLDVIKNTSFVGNTARVGGALRLAGTATLYNCTFVENTSAEDEGPAVSNIGVVSSMSASLFMENRFDCERQTYLYYSDASDGVLFDVVCHGCDVACEDCNFLGNAPGCSVELDHSNSTGGSTTLETLSIYPGYWRATNTSTDVLKCYNTDACLGGVTGSPAYCGPGYEGPYCSVCSDGYTATLGFTCNACSEPVAGIVVASFVAALAATIAVLVIVHLVTGNVWTKADKKPRRVSATWRRRLQSLKIVIVVWQILTQFVSVANVTYPDIYQTFLDGIGLLNLDPHWVLSMGCIVDLDFHKRLILYTTWPLIALAALGVTYLIATSRGCGSDEDIREARRKHLSMVLWLTFLVYSSVSSILFQAFACDDLDDGETYLRADYRIRCDSDNHVAIQFYSIGMIVLYTVGIPAFYATILFKNREVLMDERARQRDTVAESTSNLWELYKPSCFYYELVECFRRILLSGIVVFIFPNTAGQIAIALVLGVFFMVVSEAFAPYAWALDTWVSRAGHAIVCTSMYLALLLKVDVAAERARSERVFEAVLVCVQACMILAIVLEAVIVSWRVVWEKLKEESQPRRGSNDVSMRLEFMEDVDPASHPSSVFGEVQDRTTWGPGFPGIFPGERPSPIVPTTSRMKGHAPNPNASVAGATPFDPVCFETSHAAR